MTTLTRIGFIGLGAMGRGMATNLVKGGFEVRAYDLSDQAVEALVAVGGVAAASPRDAAASAGLVITMLPNAPDVEAVLGGPEGILATAGDGRRLMNSSTIDPAETRRLGQMVEAAGWRFLDCPLGRTADHARRGESLFMLGGRSEDKAAVRPALEAMGTSILDCGKVGEASAIKLANNYLSIVTAVATCEALRLAESGGVMPDALLQVVNDTLAMNGHTKIGFPAKVLAGDVQPGFAIDHAHKDLGIAIAAMAREGVPCFLGEEAYALYSEARKRGLGGNDWSDLHTLVGQLWQENRR